MFRIVQSRQPPIGTLLIIVTVLVLGQSHSNHSYSLVRQLSQPQLRSPYQKVSIKMPKFLPYPLGFPSRGSDLSTPSSGSHIANNTSLPSHIGGLGLASGSQNRISLSALSKRPGHSEDGHLEPTPKRFAGHLKQPDPPAAGPPVGPDQTRPDPFALSVRVIGQSVSNTLQPDLSPEKVRKLRRILADSLDTKWTSETPPRVIIQRGLSDSLDQFDQNLVDQAQRLNFSLRRPQGLQYSPANEQLQLFRTWLVELASCEMEYIWEDLGSLFWPRWIRRGVCLNNNHGNSCSWPPGMKCKPTGSRDLKLLHWKCNEQAPDSKDEDQRMPVQPAGRTRRAFQHRFQRHTLANTYHSSFRDMDPVVFKEAESSMEEPRVVRPSERASPFQHPTPNKFIPKRPMREYMTDEMSSSAPRWQLPRNRLPRGSANDGTRRERQKRRARRLLKRLSVNKNGYHCSWQTQSYLINDKCSCSCVQ